MELKDKIVGLFLIGIMTLLTWNLHQTWTMKEEVFKLQQGQVVLHKQIKKINNLVKKKLKKNKKNK
jgi:hypothetical protein